MRIAVFAQLIGLSCLCASGCHAYESDILFVLLQTNPLSGFSVFDQVSKGVVVTDKDYFKQMKVNVDGSNQIDLSQGLLFRQHNAKVTGRSDYIKAAPFATLSVLRAYEPQNPYDRLRIKNNTAITQTDSYGFATGAEYSEGGRWWSIAAGYNQITKRDYFSRQLLQTRQAVTFQYALYDKSFAPYIFAAFMGLDAGIGGIYARLTPYITLQDGLLVGPDVHAYRDSSMHKFKLGAALAGLHYKAYDILLGLGYEQDSYRHQGAYGMVSMIHHF